MREIEFNEKKYCVPENWNEISVNMLIKASELSDLLPDAPVVAIVSAYTNIPIEELKVSKVNIVNDILSILEFIFVPYKPEMQNEFTFNGIHYKAKEDIVEMEFQDWISIQTTLYNNRDKPVLALPRIIAVLAKKDGETLDDIDLNERSELFKQLPYPIAKNLEFFFTNIATALKSITLLSSTEKEQESIILQRFHDLNNIMQKRKEQSGTSLLMKFQIGIYQLYLRSLRRDLEKSYNSTRTKLSKKNYIETVKSSYMKQLNANKKSN